MPSIPDTTIANLKNLVMTGIGYEDDFIVKYLKILRDGDFMGLFGEERQQAELLLSTMIEESNEHKQALEKIYQKL